MIQKMRTFGVCFSLIFLIFSQELVRAECKATGALTTTIIKNKWFGFAAEMISFKLYGYIDINGQSTYLSDTFSNVDKYYKIRDEGYICELYNNTGTEYIGVDDSGESVIITPDTIRFRCICY